MNLAEIIRCPTEFRFLNDVEPIMIGTNRDDIEIPRFISELEQELYSEDIPLVRHLREISRLISDKYDNLIQRQEIVTITIIVSGEVTDGDIEETLITMLADLPIYIVIRLCTTDDEVINYWLAVCEGKEKYMEVIIDLISEAESLHRLYPWLTYGEPLHRIR